MVNNTTQLLIHSEIMRDVVNFLEDHNLIPATLAINGNGWVEATFHNSNKATWHTLAKQRKIDIEAPLLTIEDGSGSTLLRVKFRLTAQKNRWQRLLRRTS